MATPSSPFLGKLVSHIDKLDPSQLQDQVLSLARRRGLLEAVLQVVEEGVLVVTSEGNVSYANQTAEALLGGEGVRLVGRPISRYLPDLDWVGLSRRDEESWKQLSRLELELTRPTRRLLSICAFPLEADGTGDEPGVVVILRDVTRERQDAEAAMEGERMEAVRLLAATLAHEIGNPLNAIGLHLQLLERAVRKGAVGEKDAECLDLVGVARKEVGRLDQILSRFLQALRPVPPTLEPCDILPVLAETVHVMEADINVHRIRVSIDHPATLPRIRADAEQLKQVFFNIIKNAVQAMADGGTLAISVSADDRDLSIAFRDNGIGMEEKDLGRIFRPFQTGKADGHGIGLAVAERIVREHGARIDISSLKGEGTCFRLVFPLADRQAPRLKDMRD